MKKQKEKAKAAAFNLSTGEAAPVVVDVIKDIIGGTGGDVFVAGEIISHVDESKVLVNPKDAFLIETSEDLSMSVQVNEEEVEIGSEKSESYLVSTKKAKLSENIYSDLFSQPSSLLNYPHKVPAA